MDELHGEQCPACGKNTLTLREKETTIDHFGKVYIFSMKCEDCGYKKADLESAEKKSPVKYTLEIEKAEDLNITLVKSGGATLKVPRIITIEPGEFSEGYITTVEGVFKRIKQVVKMTYESEEDETKKKKAKNLLKKLNKILAGHEPTKIMLSDPTGNSAILSDKAIKGKY